MTVFLQWIYCICDSQFQLPEKCLADHYGVVKEDVFLGHRKVAYPLYTDSQINQEFQAFKHEMRMIKYVQEI